MVRRTQTVYITTDPFFSPRGKVLNGLDLFLEELARSQMPAVWITGWTRAQLDEPRRRLGQSDPYIGENGSGVYLPEDYFHLKGASTVRLGRYTCIPIAKPQPAAEEALEQLSADLDISVVPLRSLSQRELSQNTGLPGKEAESIRLRDFDELFFFAGVSPADIDRFREEAKTRGVVIQRAGQFWSLSCGASLARCVRELGGLYDRVLRSHAHRIGVRVMASKENGSDIDQQISWPSSAFDRTLILTEHNEPDEEPRLGEENLNDPKVVMGSRSAMGPGREGHFHLRAPELWADVMASITRSAEPHR